MQPLSVLSSLQPFFQTKRLREGLLPANLRRQNVALRYQLDSDLRCDWDIVLLRNHERPGTLEKLSAEIRRRAIVPHQS